MSTVMSTHTNRSNPPCRRRNCPAAPSCTALEACVTLTCRGRSGQLDTGSGVPWPSSPLTDATWSDSYPATATSVKTSDTAIEVGAQV